MNSWRIVFVISIIVLLQCVQSEEHGGYTVINKVRYPYSAYYTPFMGLIIAFSVKLVPSEIEADLSWNIEANYLLPQNESEYTFPPVIPGESSERHYLERPILYKLLEMKLDSFSETYGGKNCFLRILCEIASLSTKDTDIIGDIFHIILSPSSSIDKDLPKKYINAENYGSKNTHCKKYAKKCPINLLNFFTVIEDILEYKIFT
ncbi:hypothetical protein GWI33_007926 [Rhynchophorus ferrugineus]|uniref:Uncharacterized protein n=1 Tax=Rhynchophorus ferrugineus TaxID=354439 RepID=A0A834IGV9_RHYFE|nr:hypothetical protein GWI33_007926 [Rhynchophorus ferrugineus]